MNISLCFNASNKSFLPPPALPLANLVRWPFPPFMLFEGVPELNCTSAASFSQSSNSQGYTRWKSGDWNLILLSHVDGRNPITWSHHLLPSNMCVSRRLIRKWTSLGLNQHSHVMWASLMLLHLRLPLGG